MGFEHLCKLAVLALALGTAPLPAQVPATKPAVMITNFSDNEWTLETADVPARFQTGKAYQFEMSQFIHYRGTAVATWRALDPAKAGTWSVPAQVSETSTTQTSGTNVLWVVLSPTDLDTAKEASYCFYLGGANQARRLFKVTCRPGKDGGAPEYEVAATDAERIGADGPSQGRIDLGPKGVDEVVTIDDNHRGLTINKAVYPIKPAR